MAVNTPTQPQSSQLSRDALLVHGLALVFAAATVGTAVWVVARDKEFMRAVGVGLSATFVLIVWSVILAVRALWRGQSARWPAVVLALCGLEAAAVCFLHLLVEPHNMLWGGTNGSLVVALGLPVFAPVFVALGLPVFVPVFVLASYAGVGVAWWRVRRAETRDLATGARAGTPVPQAAAPWTRQRRWKRGMAWYGAITALAVAVLLPCPLFVYCLYTSSGPWTNSFRIGDWQFAIYRSGWRGWVLEHTPVVVGEASAAILSPMKGFTAQILYEQALSTGRVSQARLLSGLSSTKGAMQYGAMEGLFLSNHKAALDLATRLADGKVQGASPSLLEEAGSRLGKYGSIEEIRGFLDPAHAPQPPSEFLEHLIENVFYGGHRLELLPDLERICQGDSPVRDEDMRILAQFGSPEQLKRIWPGFLADTTYDRQCQALEALDGMDTNVRLEIMLGVFDGRNQELKNELLFRLPVGDLIDRTISNADRRLLVRLIKFLLPLLEEKDRGRRSEATTVLADAANADGFLRNQCYVLNEGIKDHRAKTVPGPEEQELIKKVRDVAVKWLQENDK